MQWHCCTANQFHLHLRGHLRERDLSRGLFQPFHFSPAALFILASGLLTLKVSHCSPPICNVHAHFNSMLTSLFLAPQTLLVTSMLRAVLGLLFFQWFPTFSYSAIIISMSIIARFTSHLICFISCLYILKVSLNHFLKCGLYLVLFK